MKKWIPISHILILAISLKILGIFHTVAIIVCCLVFRLITALFDEAENWRKMQ